MRAGKRRERETEKCAPINQNNNVPIEVKVNDVTENITTN